jgi:hypothetical protein
VDPALLLHVLRRAARLALAPKLRETAQATYDRVSTWRR